jgi:hypothetical protein
VSKPESAFVVAVLATWRISHLIAKEDGPFDLVLRARARAGTSVLGRLMDCPYCVSVWAALPLAGWVARRGGLPAADVVPAWLAISAGACLLEQATSGGQQPAGVEVIEQPSEPQTRRNDDVLW